MLPKSLGTVSKQGGPYKLLTIYYIFGMIPLVTGLDLATIQKFTVANSLLSRLFVCVTLYLFASRHGDVLLNCPLKMSPGKAKVFAVAGFIVLVILSSSLLKNLSITVVIFLAALVIITLIYTATYAKNITLENDLRVDYTTGEADENE